MDEIIIIRAVDTDGSLFERLLNTLNDRAIHVIEATPSVLSFGDIEIQPAVLKAGKEVPLNHGEYSMLYCMAKSPGRVFTKDQLYAWHGI